MKAGRCPWNTIRCSRNSPSGPQIATEAIARLQRALGECDIQGIQTTIPFFRRVLEHPDFIAGKLETGFIDRVLAEGLMREVSPVGGRGARCIARGITGRGTERRHAIGLSRKKQWMETGRTRRRAPSAAATGREGGSHEASRARSKWRRKPASTKWNCRPKRQQTAVRSFRSAANPVRRTSKRSLQVCISLILNGKTYEAYVSKRPGDTPGIGQRYVIVVGPRRYVVELHDPRRWRRSGSSIETEGPQEIVAPMPGKIVKILVTENQEVSATRAC